MVFNLPESLAVTSPPRQRVRVISSDVVTMVKCMSCLVHSPGHCEGSRRSEALMYLCVWSLSTPGTPCTGTDVASKWAFLVVICSLQGVAHSCRKLLQLKQHVATFYLQ